MRDEALDQFIAALERNDIDQLRAYLDAGFDVKLTPCFTKIESARVGGLFDGPSSGGIWETPEERERWLNRMPVMGSRVR